MIRAVCKWNLSFLIEWKNIEDIAGEMNPALSDQRIFIIQGLEENAAKKAAVERGNSRWTRSSSP